MRETDAGLPRRRRDLKRRLDELRGERARQPADPAPPPLRADVTPPPRVKQPEVARREIPPTTPPREPPRRSLDSSSNDRAVPAVPKGEGKSSRADRWRRARRALTDEPSSGVSAPPPRPSAVPDPAQLAVDEWIDPATAAEDEFSPDFPSAVPFPDTVAYFDLETTGLGAHERVAVSGTLRPEGTGLRLRQHLAFDAAQERAALEATLADFAGLELLVTYNGRTFDLPFLKKRLAWHRLPPLPDDLEHLDLLLAIRKQYRGVWPDCSLGTAEIELLKKRRLGPDVPGKEVPLRFADVCAGAPLDLLVPVIRHNRVDLTSLVAIHWGREVAEAADGGGSGEETVD